MISKETAEQIGKGKSGLQIKPGYGDYLTVKRIEKGLTVKKLAELTGVPERNLYNIEKENMKGYSIHDIRHYLLALDIPQSDIFI